MKLKREKKTNNCNSQIAGIKLLKNIKYVSDYISLIWQRMYT
jgi:hypothetical protein